MHSLYFLKNTKICQIESQLLKSVIIISLYIHRITNNQLHTPIINCNSDGAMHYGITSNGSMSIAKRNLKLYIFIASLLHRKRSNEQIRTSLYNKSHTAYISLTYSNSYNNDNILTNDNIIVALTRQ